MSAYDSEEAFEALMDDMQVIYCMKAGDTVSQADVDALNRLDNFWRDDSERACDAYARGWKEGMTHGGSADIAAMQERLDAKISALSVEKTLRKFDEQRGFRRGAQACRETMARFVEQGGDATTASSIRLNWNPAWGDDPGAPEDGSQTPLASDGEGGSALTPRADQAKPQEPRP